jgi:hypothetical protein
MNEQTVPYTRPRRVKLEPAGQRISDWESVWRPRYLEACTLGVRELKTAVVDTTPTDWAGVARALLATLAAGAAIYQDDRLVYFVRVCGVGPVKIGVAGDPAARVASMRTAHAGELVLLGSVPGGINLERKIHDVLAPWRVRGEWFKDSGEVMSVVTHLTNPASAVSEPTPEIRAISEFLREAIEAPIFEAEVDA